jgi:putative spermidine/putrescine transport system substrate-binding protein
MAGAYTSRMFAANKADNRHFKVVWPGSVYAIDFWAVLKGTPNRAQAMQLVTYMTRPERQKDFPTYAFQGITNLEAIGQVDATVAPDLPTYPANMAQAVALDVDFWVENNDQLNQRFNAWASQ